MKCLQKFTSDFVCCLKQFQYQTVMYFIVNYCNVNYRVLEFVMCHVFLFNVMV